KKVTLKGQLPVGAAGRRCRFNFRHVGQGLLAEDQTDGRSLQTEQELQLLGDVLVGRHGAAAYSRARLKSATMSSRFSMPQLRRIRSSKMPSLARSAALIPACEVIAGRVTRLSTLPRLGAT